MLQPTAHSTSSLKGQPEVTTQHSPKSEIKKREALTKETRKGRQNINDATMITPTPKMRRLRAGVITFTEEKLARTFVKEQKRAMLLINSPFTN